MAFLNETGLATFLSYLKAWARATFASKTDTQTIEGATTFSQTVTGSITGNAGTATRLKTAKNINGVAFDGSANITVADSTKVSKSGDTMTGALNGRASNVNLAVEPSSTKEDFRFYITRNTADTVHTGNLMRLGVAQGANTKDYRIMFGVANPRAGNLPTQESIAGGEDDSDARTSNCWGGIGVYYDYSKNRAYPYCSDLDTCAPTDNSNQRLATNRWVRTATGNFACNASSAAKLATARSLKTKLDSTTDVTFDGSADQNAVPVTGILQVANGGTGSSSKNFVDLSTDQNISGNKTFSDEIIVSKKNPILSLANTGTSSTYCDIRLKASNGNSTTTLRDNYQGDFTIGHTYQGEGWGYGAALDLYYGSGNFSLSACAGASGTRRRLLGESGGTLKWNGQNIQTTSDQRLKTKLESIPDEVLDAWEGVEWGQFQYLEAVEEKGKSARLHTGLVSQQVQMAFSDRGLDACGYGLICHDNEKDLWMLRYAEALCMECAYQRRRANRLESRVVALEEMLYGK